MSYEQHIDDLATLMADEATLDGMDEEDQLAMQRSMEVASDSLAFCQSLWDLLTEHGMITDDTTPDLHKMEKIIDLLYAELGAVTVVFSDPRFAGMSKFFNQLADQWSKQKELPPELAKGARRFAARLTNTKNMEKVEAARIDLEP